MTERERFVPQRVSELTDLLCNELRSAELESETSAVASRTFRSFSRLVAALFHFEFYDREQTVLAAWELAGSEADAADVVAAELSGLLDAASYHPVSVEDLHEALATESLVPLRLDVDLDDYEELLIYRRGARSEVVEVKKFFGLKKEQKTITVDDRVVVHTRIKPQSWFDEKGIDAAERNLVPGHVAIKQFQDVPRADIEMLLPSTQVKFRLKDSLMIGVPALAGGVAVLATKLLPTIGLILLLTGAWIGVKDETPVIDQAALLILFGGMMALGSFGMRQFTKMKNRKVDYLKTLSENLYFRTLANGSGVLHSLLSAAEEQEVAEVLLGYHFLRQNPGATIGDLDQAIEAWLQAQAGISIDFDVQDAVEKLRLLGILHGLRRLRVDPLDVALSKLDERWDAIFELSDGSAGERSLLGRSSSPALVRFRKVIGKFRGGSVERRVQQEV